MAATVRQCPTCPWRVDCDPAADIPNGYSCDLHERLRGTIAEPGAVRFTGVQRIMACHYSKVGEETPCAGWLHHQRGAGNNIQVRMALALGQLPVPVVDGDQHQDFDSTLPKGKR